MVQITPDSASFALPDKTQFIECFVIDVNGIPRGKRIPSHAWPDLVENGISFSASSLILDATGASRGPKGIGTEDGDPDAIAWPVPGTIAPVPWNQQITAQTLLTMRARDGKAFWYDPRVILQSVVDRCQANGIFPVVACELEFYLTSPQIPVSVPSAARAGNLCLHALESDSKFLHALHDALSVQNIPSGALVSEYGPGQFELNLAHGPDPVLAADQAVLQRRAARGVAASMGQHASFMAKPFAPLSGNGLHIHVSLVDENGKNRFGATGGERLLHQAIAGMQRLHAQSMAVFAPNFSAYRRYRAGAFVSLSSSWGEDNRSVAFRIPASGAAARRIEHRVAGADASPHLVMAAILAAIDYGITHRLEPGPASFGDAKIPDPQLPRDIFSALCAWENADILPGYFGADFISAFAALKRAEAQDLLSEVFPREHEFYL